MFGEGRKADADTNKRPPWTVKECKILIEIFKQHSNLWDHSQPDSKNKSKRLDSLKLMAKMFNCSMREIDRKTKNLASQYRRERRIEEKFKKFGGGQNYHSKWFAYEAMSFLKDVYKAKGPYDGKRAESWADDWSSDSDPSNDMLFSDVEKVPPLVAFPSPKATSSAAASSSGKKCFEKQYLSPAKLKAKRAPSGEQSREQPSSPHSDDVPMKVAQKDERGRDQFEIYGELVGQKLRSLKTSYARATVQHLINQVLYDADIGKYNFAKNLTPGCASTLAVIGTNEELAQAEDTVKFELVNLQ